jgi:hypothetical protein
MDYINMAGNGKHGCNMIIESKVISLRLINIAAELTYPEKVDQVFSISVKRNTLLNWLGNKMSSPIHGFAI